MLSTRRYLFGTTVLAGTLALAAPAFAQTAPVQTPAAAASQDQDEDESVVEDVVVVGSRIRRDTYNSPSPVQIVTRDETILAGYESTTAALQGTAVTGGTAQVNNAFGGFVTNGGPGANTLGLRGLGPERTLILLNGRRLAPSGSRGGVGSADLNVLPSAVVERIEVLRDGASSIYGSDAIAGVLNIITRDNIEGITVEGQYNFTGDADGAGDSSRISIVGGLKKDRLYLAGTLERFDREELTLGDREFTRCNRDLRINRATGGTLDFIDPLTGQSRCYPIGATGANGVTINTIGTPTVDGVGAAGSVGTRFNRFRPNAGVTTGVAGFEGVGGGLNNLNVRDTFEPRLLDTSLISPVQNTTAFVEGRYDTDILGNAELYFEGLFNRRESQQTGYRQLTLDYRFGSPLIPANLRFATPFSPAQAGGTTGTTPIGVRAFIGFGTTVSEQTIDFTKVVAGIRGDLFLSGWRYDAHVSRSLSEGSSSNQSFLTDLLTQTSDVITAPAGTDPTLIRGGLTCRVNITVPGTRCIPAPVLNSQTIGGQLPQDFRDYILRTVTGNTEFTETVFSVGIDGDLFTLPAGTVGAFFGAEYRDQEIDDQPALDSQNNNLFGLTSAAPTVGTDSVVEVFGEIEFPLLANVPFAKELTLNVSARYTDYESYGADTTYKVGLLYTPVDWVSFRGTYGTSYRAPALSEQFQGSTSGFISSQADPCNNFGAPNVNPNVVANCLSQGLQPDFTATTGIRVLNEGGAAQGLEAETSENLTVGLILQPALPSALGQVSFAADYYEIDVSNGVGQLGPGAILGPCFNRPSAEFLSGEGECRFIDPRAAGSNQLTVRDVFTNIASNVVEGIDYNLRYSRDLWIGTFLANIGVTQYFSQFFQGSPTNVGTESNGTLNSPEYTATLNATYAWNNWRVRYGVEWIRGTEGDSLVGTDPESPNPALNQFDFVVPDYYLHSASVQYRTEGGWAATAGVRNLFNEDPPTISSGAFNRVGNAPLYSGYDLVGRTFFINLAKSF